MRFIFHNPHDSLWYKSPFTLNFKKNRIQKYVHLLDYFLERNKRVYVFIDREKVTPRSGFSRFLPALTGFYVWAIYNNINPCKFKIITDAKKLKDDDVIFMFVYGNFTNQNGEITETRKNLNTQIGQSKAFKIVHLTHYMYHADIASINCNKSNIDLFVAENNLYKNSAFFRTTFDWYKKDAYVLPFVPKDKYKRFKPFKERVNKVIATGTITFPMDDNTFVSFFKQSKLQPMRNEIYQNSENLNIYLDSIISPINEGGVSYPKQQQYFNYNIVELYNNYKMFVVPEEISGLPGIGFVEGMNCGSAFIGLNDPMYTDIGLIDKVNFIGYDGTLTDLKFKIGYYQIHQNELEKIAENGYKLVKEKFNKIKVTEDFLNYISEITKINTTRLI